MDSKESSRIIFVLTFALIGTASFTGKLSFVGVCIETYAFVVLIPI